LFWENGQRKVIYAFRRLLLQTPKLPSLVVALRKRIIDVVTNGGSRPIILMAAMTDKCFSGYYSPMDSYLLNNCS
jgi:hypothetical protein